MYTYMNFVCLSVQYNIPVTIIVDLCCSVVVIYINIFHIIYYSDHSEEHLPNIMWCRDTFMEALNEIKDIN